MADKTVENKLDKIKKLREAYRKSYNNHIKEIKKLNEQFVILAQETDNLLGVMEKVVEMQK